MFMDNWKVTTSKEGQLVSKHAGVLGVNGKITDNRDGSLN